MLNQLSELRKILGTDDNSRVTIMNVTKASGDQLTLQSQERTFIATTNLTSVAVGDDVIVSNNVVIGFVEAPTATIFIS